MIKNILSESSNKEKKAICKHLGIEFTNDIEKIYKHYQEASGHSVVNLFRKEEIPYKQILIDVADKLHDGMGWTHYTLEDSTNEEEIENKIMNDVENRVKKMKKEWDKLSPEKKEKKEKNLRNELAKKGYDTNTINGVVSMITTGVVSCLAANTVAISIFYTGFFGGLFANIIGVSLAQLIGGGVIAGAVVAAPLLIALAGTPAYRKTIPVTILIIQIKNRVKMEKEL